MRDIVRVIFWMVVDLIRLRAALEAEILTLRQQINVLRRTAPKTQTFSAIESIDFCLPLSASPWRSRCAGDCQAGDRSQMASRWLPIILAMEIESAGWQANSSVGDTPAYPRDERCQSAVGSASDPWRARQARRRYRTDQRGQVHGQATRSAVPRLEDILPQSR